MDNELFKCQRTERRTDILASLIIWHKPAPSTQSKGFRAMGHILQPTADSNIKKFKKWRENAALKINGKEMNDMNKFVYLASGGEKQQVPKED
jgi:hypothetical protein